MKKLLYSILISGLLIACGEAETENPLPPPWVPGQEDMGVDSDHSDADVSDMVMSEDMMTVDPSFNIEVQGPTVAVSWSLDANAEYPNFRLLRKAQGAPDGPDDLEADVVFDGAGGTATHPTDQLHPSLPDASRTYTYRIYRCNEVGECLDLDEGQADLSISLMEALAGGGYTIWWRHASASQCQDNLSLGRADTTEHPDWWKSCERDCSVATARQITNEPAEAEGAAVQSIMSAHGVEYDRVLSSEFCRCTQTAELWSLGPQVEELPELTYYVYNEAARCSDTFVLLNQQPAAGQNTALIGHAGNSCAPLSQLAMAEAAVYMPTGGEEPEFIARVRWDHWNMFE